MLIDQRQIRFPPEDLVAAIGGSPSAAAALGLPPLKPKAVHLHGDTNKVEVVFHTGGGPRSVTIDLLSLAALLLSFCFRAKIPLPRKARKAAKIERGSLVLDFTMEFEPDLTALRPEAAMAAGTGAKSLSWGKSQDV